MHEYICRQCSICHRVYPGESLQLHSLAGHTFRQRCRHHRRRRFSHGAGFIGPAHRPVGLVRPLMAPDRVQLRRLRQRKMLNRRLRRRNEVHRRRRSARDAGGVHHRIRRQGLLRREPGGRLQRGRGRAGYRRNR